MKLSGSQSLQNEKDSLRPIQVFRCEVTNLISFVGVVRK